MDIKQEKGMVPQTILVIEDDPAMRRIVSLVLEDEGYQVLQASSGESAVSVLEISRPHLIVCDVMMPGMDGFTFLEQLHANPQWTTIPFIFLTAMGHRSDIRRGMGLGADDYLTKPFEPEDLLTAVEVRLARATATEAAAKQATIDFQKTTLRTLCHEFRTPLTLIVGYADLLGGSVEDAGTEEFCHLLQGLREGSARLTELVEGFLLLTKLENGTIAQQSQSLLDNVVEPDQVVRRVAKQFENKAAERKVSISVDTRAPGVSVALSARFTMEIVRRLVDNAIKFSKSQGGQVILSTRRFQDSWILDVADQGIGIRPDVLDDLFEAFRQVDRDKMEQQGVGLGLAIVRRLAELHGGSVGVKSDLGQGSTFTVQLPITTTDRSG